MDDVQKNFHGLKYCPKCAGDLKDHYEHQHRRLRCSECGYMFYFNPVAVTGCVAMKDDKILLVRRRFNPGKGDWCIPAGFIEYGEWPQDTAIREFREETGLDIKIEGVHDIWYSQDDPRTPVIMIMYRGTITGGTLCPGDDADDAAFFGRDEVPQNIAFVTHKKCVMKIFEGEG